MRKALNILGLLVRIAAFIFLSLLAFIAWRAIPIEKSLQADASEAHRVLLEAGLTAKEAREASADERQYLKAELPRIAGDTEKILHDSDSLLLRANRSAELLDSVARAASQTIDKAGADLDDIGPVLDETRKSVAGLQPILDETRKSIAGLQPIEADASHLFIDADALVNSPDIPATFKNVNEGTAEIAATAKDVREEVHAITHPTPLGRIIGWAMKAGEMAGTWFGGIL